MIEGRITFSNVSSRIGFIQGDDDKTYRFSYDDMSQSDLPPMLRGRRVRFQPDGQHARAITLLEEAATPLSAASASSRGSATASTPVNVTRVPAAPAPADITPHTRFLNPYNFVRYLGKARPGNHVLGDCPPPPHDRYVGLSGRITCELKNVTPLFVSDSHNINEDVREHRSYRFFETPEGKKAIPGTSLRGMLRSVFEAATNACFGVLGNARLSHRLVSEKAPWLVPARVEWQKDKESPEGKKWVLRLLTGTSALRIGEPPDDEQYAGWVHRYWPVKPSKTLLKQPPIPSRVRDFQTRTAPGTEVDLQGFQHGGECYALIELRQHPHPNIKFWDVLEVSQDKEALEKRKNELIAKRSHQQRDKFRVVRGWLCLTNQNVEAKHSERFFFRTTNDTLGARFVDLTSEVCTFYEDLIADYQDRHERERLKRSEWHQPLDQPITNEATGSKDSGLSRFIYHTRERHLSEGDLVYTMLSGTSTNPHVDFIVPVSVPRIAYNYRIADLLAHTPHTRHCTCYDILCPACRTFGWVHEDAAELPPTMRTAYAGRVRLSHAELTNEQEIATLGGAQGITLAILSTPKPTTTQFYLFGANGKPDARADYDNPQARLRGRKFYQHHGEKPSQYPDQQQQQLQNEYERAGDEKDDQNRTVRGALDIGSVFCFTLDFENLAPAELGALLWSLELEDGMHHRLGYGKPLGFGSVTIRVEELCVMQLQHRYTSLANTAQSWEIVETGQWKQWVQQFKEQMVQWYDKPFEKLDNIRDLHALLSAPSNVHIHYPRLHRQPDLEGKNFEWFVKNKRFGQHTLDPADTDGGLPLDPS